jgi:hypothetical protein
MNVSIKTTWKDIIDAAMTTIGLNKSLKVPTSKWKKRILLAEHSPIRLLIINWKWEKLKYWISVHFVRHKIGIEHFVRTQRSDRTGKNRENMSQSSFVTHECTANAQAIINISRKRLCSQASKETIEAWKEFLINLKYKEPELFDVCVPECIYRGFCPEFKPCGYSNTDKYLIELENYRKMN